MKLNERKGSRLFLGTLFGVLALFVVARAATDFYVDILWFDSVGYLDVFWTRTFWTWGIRLIGMVLVAGAIYLNLKYVAKTLGGIRIKRRLGDLEISEQLPKAYIALAITGISVIMGLWFGASVPRSIGLGVLFMRGAPEWGVVDPILGKDLMFYVLSLPIVSAAVTFAMILAFLSFSLSAAGYAATGAVRWDKRSVYFEDQSRRHLAFLVAAFFALLSIRLFLGRYILLLGGTSSVEGIVGFTDVAARLPAMRILSVLAAFAAVGAVWSGLKGRILPFGATFGGLVVGGIALGQLYPAFVQRFQVEPNELVRETPYIEHAIEFTKFGYGLQDIERRTFDYSAEEESDWSEASRQFAGLPIWNEDALLTAYREREGRRRYYEFDGITIDRYDGPDGPVPVALSVREVDAGGIPDPNWQNLHIRRTFVSGAGAVASAANAKTEEGQPSWFLSDIPMTFDAAAGAPPALDLAQPSVFFGTQRSRLQSYAILNPEEHPTASGDPGTPGVDVPSGLGLDSFFRKLALAWYFQDLNLLFAAEVSNESRLVFRRNVQDRIREISGDLIRFYEDPYPVVTPDGIVWMMEGFIGSRWFPLSSSDPLPGRAQQLKYLRNSVKITVDAVTGEVAFYVVDSGDPLLQAYRNGFPTLFRDFSEMPEQIREHVRYPRTMMLFQSEVLARYHQEDPAVFHRQQDVWDQPVELARSTTPEPYLPEYGLYRLPGEEEIEFLLSTAFVPDGRQNLAALLVARNDADRLGELVLYEMPPGEQIAGPRQVEALVEQDPEISQQFSLWRTGGSEVWTGHLHVVPVGRTLLYMESVYLAAEADAIPELRRFVVSDGRRVAMGATLREAIGQLAGSSVELPTAVRTALDPAGDEQLDPAVWPSEALSILDEAEALLRDGDFAGFGAALDRLRELLSGLSGGGPIP